MTTYYCAPNGSDSNAGSSASPWKTLAKFAAVANPDDELQMRGGTYDTQLSILRCGAREAPIVVRNYPGEVATIRGFINFGNGTSPTASTGAWWEFRGDDQWRLRFDGSSALTTQYALIGVYGDGVKILGCEIFCTRTNNRGTIDMGHGPTVPRETEVGWNKIHDTGPTQLHHAVYAGQAIAPYVHDNYCYDLGGCGGQFGPGCDGGIFEDNTVDVTGLAGVVVWSDPSYANAPITRNCIVRRNILSNGANYSMEDFHSGLESGAGNNKFIENYCFANARGKAVAPPAGATFENNIENGTDPMYVNRAGKDFHLQAGSPAAGYGVSSTYGGTAPEPPASAPVSNIHEGDVLSGVENWTVNGIEPGTIRVKFWVDNVCVHTREMPAEQITYQLDTTGAPDGPHIVGIGWVDKNNVSYPASPPTNVTVDNSNVTPEPDEEYVLMEDFTALQTQVNELAKLIGEAGKVLVKAAPPASTQLSWPHSIPGAPIPGNERS
jgi:hypothetical protein